MNFHFYEPSKRHKVFNCGKLPKVMSTENLRAAESQMKVENTKKTKLSVLLFEACINSNFNRISSLMMIVNQIPFQASLQSRKLLFFHYSTGLLCFLTHVF